MQCRHNGEGVDGQDCNNHQGYAPRAYQAALPAWSAFTSGLGIDGSLAIATAVGYVEGQGLKNRRQRIPARPALTPGLSGGIGRAQSRH